MVDNGKGISQKIRERIFGMFFVGNNQSTGFGLGLYQAKIAISKLEGTISIEDPEKGSTGFVVKVPLA